MSIYTITFRQVIGFFYYIIKLENLLIALFKSTTGTWGLIDVPASIEYYKDTNTNKTKAQMVYKIKMRRKSRFYIVNIIIPTFLLSFLSVCVFYLPTDDGEKITLSLSILFALGKQMKNRNFVKN